MHWIYFGLPYIYNMIGSRTGIMMKKNMRKKSTLCIGLSSLTEPICAHRMRHKLNEAMVPKGKYRWISKDSIDKENKL